MMKIKNKLIIIMIIMLLFPKTILAYTYTVPIPSTGEDSNETDREENDNTIIVGLGKDGNNTYTCKYKYDVTSSSQVTFDIYNSKNENITSNSLNISENNAIKAGTAIGVKIYESKGLKVKGTYWVEVEQEAVNCKQCIKCINTTLCDNSNINDEREFLRPTSYSSLSTFSEVKKIVISSCEPVEQDEGTTTCPSGTEQYGDVYNCNSNCVSNPATTYNTSNSGKLNACKEKFLAAVSSSIDANIKSPTYEIYLNDSNNYPGNNDSDDPNRKIQGKREDNGKSIDEIVTDFLEEVKNAFRRESDNKQTVSIEFPKENEKPIIYNYKPNKVCINAKTSQVKYLLEDSTDCTWNEQTGIYEYEVKNNTIYDDSEVKEHWHYFTPLNANSINDFIISVLHYNSNTPIKSNVCKQIIQDEENEYQNLMVDINGNPLIGLSGNETESEKRQIIQNAKSQVNDGCRLQSIIRIPIKQEFYNEVIENNTTKFKGFNFYYRPINTNFQSNNKEDVVKTVFPNGIASNSLWYDWSQNQNGINLTKSFSNVTYITQGLNLNNIRTYNKNNPYTSWKNMYRNGTSAYINDTNNGIYRTSYAQTPYKLGCGPVNINSQEECAS